MLSSWKRSSVAQSGKTFKKNRRPEKYKPFSKFSSAFTQTQKIPLLIFILIAGFVFIFCNDYLAAEEQMVRSLTEQAAPLAKSEDLNPLLALSEDKKLVLLGEASHGTSEYYLWRKKISRRLIKEKDFSFIVVEGDWPSCFAVNLYVLGLSDDTGETKRLLRENYRRWPRWMWANEDVVKLVDWLKEYNAELPLKDRIGFYGMDVYSMEESAKAVIRYLHGLDGDYFREIADKYNTLAQFDYDGFGYARAAHMRGIDAREEVKEVLAVLEDNSSDLIEKDRFAYFNAKMNALAVKNAEKYYRTAVLGGAEGWNNRVKHMKEVVNRLLEFHGENAQGIVWAHNTHVGDARATAMRARGQINIGQLSREKFGLENVLITGFGTYQGTVLAGREWGSPLEEMTVPLAREGSIERILSEVGYEDFILVFDEASREKEHLLKPMGHRAIGVTYDPDMEHLGNYVPTILPLRYDAFLFFEETRALTPLGPE